MGQINRLADLHAVDPAPAQPQATGYKVAKMVHKNWSYNHCKFNWSDAQLFLLLLELNCLIANTLLFSPFV